MAVQRIISPAAWKDRQLNALKSNGQKNYTEGIANPKKDPIEAAKASVGAWENGIKQAIDNKAFAKGLDKTNMQEWQGYAANIGAGKLVDGVVKREGKVSKFLTTWVPTLTSTVQTLDTMPTDTASDRDQKMLANVKALRALKGTA